MTRCNKCETDRPKEAFTKSQLKKKSHDSTKGCRVCNIHEAQPDEPGAVDQLSGEDFVRLARLNFSSVEDLLDAITAESPFKRALQHRAAKKLATWCPQEELDAFLGSHERISKVVDVCTALLSIMKDFLPEPPTSWTSNRNFCVDCTGTCGDSSSQVRLPVNHAACALHVVTVDFAFFCSILHLENSDAVLLCLFRGETRTRTFVHQCIDWFRKYDKTFCKPSHLAVALLSLAIAKHPTASPVIGGASFGAVLFSVAWQEFDDLQRIGARRCDAGQSLWITRQGAERVITILPLLYHLGHWWHQRPDLFRVEVVFTIMILVLRSLRLAIEKQPRILETEVQKHYSVHYITTLFVRTEETTPWRQALANNQPYDFAFIALLEVLGWWAHRGRDLTSLRQNTPAVQNGFGDNLVPFLRGEMTKCRPVAAEIVAKLGRDSGPNIAYILPIVKAMEEGRTPRRPTNPAESLLFGPLINSNRRCGLVSCRRTAREAGIQDLERCRGCEGVEQYCCVAHQKEDWKERHKAFCKRQSTSSRTELVGCRLGSPTPPFVAVSMASSRVL